MVTVSASTASMKAVECVSGVLLIDNAVLVEKRRTHDDVDPGKVFLPGGHVEARESLGHALKREMEEELGIKVEKAVPIRVRYHTASNRERQRIHYFHVTEWKGKILSHEAESVYWESRIENLSDPIERLIVTKLLS